MSHGSEAVRRLRSSRLSVFATAFLIALAAGTAHLLTPGASIAPIVGDSAKYDRLAGGVERVLQEPHLFGALMTGRLAGAERDSLGIDRWEFQHAAGYIVPLGFLYALSPNNHGAGRTFGLFLYAVSAGLVVLIARRILGRRLAWVALVAYLAHVPFLYFGLGIATEGHATFSLLLVAYLALRFHRRPTRQAALWLGLALANLYLAKTTFRMLAALLLVGEMVYLLRPCLARRVSRAGAWRRARPLLHALAGGAVAPVLLGFGLMLLAGCPANALARTGDDALWAYRGNYVPDQGWETTGLGDAIGPELDEANRRVSRHLEPEQAGIELRRGIYALGLRLTIQSDPFGWVALVWKKFGLFWSYPALKRYLHTLTGAWPEPRLVHLLAWPLGLLGMVPLMRRRTALWIPGALALGLAFTHALTHLVARYQIPALPLWIICALAGAKVVFLTMRRAIRQERVALVAQLPWLWIGVGVLAAGVGWLLMAPPWTVSFALGRILHRVGAGLYGLSPIAAAPFLMALARAAWPLPGARLRSRWIYGALALFALPTVGENWVDQDWDAFGCTLARPGDAVVERIVLPTGLSAQPERLRSAHLEIDCLRSLHGSFQLDVLVQGRLVKSYVDTLDGRFEAFFFDAEMHDYQARYRRVSETYRRFVEEWLNPRFGRASPGYDYFRRWVRSPLPLEALAAETLQVELRLASARDGAWVRIYGDRYQKQPGLFVGPAVGENPYEHSDYRAEFLAGDRERMDARLTRPCTRWSRSREALRRGSDGRWTADLDPGWRRVGGDLRVHLRVGMQGELIRRTVNGREQATWVERPRPGDVRYDKQELRRLQWWRDSYFDGTRIL